MPLKKGVKRSQDGMQTTTWESAVLKCRQSPHWREWGKRCWPKELRTWGKTRGKRKHWTLAKVAWGEWSQLTVLTALYLWVTDGGWWESADKGERLECGPCGTALELETSVWTQVCLIQLQKDTSRNTYRYVCIQKLRCIHLFPISWEDLDAMNNMHIEASRAWFQIPFSDKKEPGLLGKMADSRAGAGKHKISLEYLGPESN